MTRVTPLVLIADDDPGARLLQSTALEGGGFQVIAVADGSQAVEAYEQLKPDCLVIDVVMPGLNGFEVCREVRARLGGAHTPILILTSRDDLESVSAAYDAGATDFAQKGLSPLLLVERVRFMLRAKQLQDELITSEARLAQAQTVARIGHWEFDSDGRTVSISPVALDIMGVTRDDVRTIKAFRHIVHPDDLPRVRQHRLTAKENRTRVSIDFRVATRDASERIVHMEGQTVHYEPGKEDHARVVTIQDITQLRRAEDHARVLAHFDPLTGLPNRAFLQEQLNLKLRNDRRGGAQVMLAIIDIEQFNRINQSYGPDAGDALLIAVGQRLKDAVALDEPRSQWNSPLTPTIVARSGGDEFVIATTLRHESGHVADALQSLADVLRAPFTIAAQEITIGATLGAAVFPNDATDSEALLRMADAALHQAKEHSRGGYQFYSADMQAHAARRLSLESELRRAIDRDQLQLHFQPRLDARSLEPVGVEALLRWHHPDIGSVSPSEFIPVAENLGLILELGEWVLDQACRHAAAFLNAGSRLRVAVNVSAVQLQRAAIADQLGAALRRYNLDPSLLEVEVTEGVLIDRPELARRALEAIKAQHIRIALDDFGTGYSSLNYLRTLPIDYLKIDRSFVADLENTDSAAIVSTILTLARGLHLSTIAEGVETEAQRKLLTRSGCNELQGFLFAPALSAEELTLWLAEQAKLARPAVTRKATLS